MSRSPEERSPSAADRRDPVRETRGRASTRSPANTESVIPYELRLAHQPRWALMEGSRHFERKSALFDALQKISKKLKNMRVNYAVMGGMALFQHGLRRFTEVIDILVTKNDLKKIHDKLVGLGYIPLHKHSTHLRDTEHGVRIEFVIAGHYPGDGKAKPVAFPEPRAVSFESDGVKYLNLPTLIELKLESGMTNPGRLRDLADVQELIRLLNLLESFSDQLNPYVREKFLEL
jgi:hypothetical protein